MDDKSRVAKLLDEFEEAIAVGHLRAHYQMLVSAHGRSVRGVEALVRWEHPSRGMLPPGVFLPAVESSSLIGRLTDWVLDESLRQCAMWRAAGWVVPVSVNLSVTLVSDPELPERVAHALARHGLPPHLLTLEVTETAIMSREGAVAEILSELRRLGVRLSVDDFGTGYTSLALLKNFRFDELKIDRTFISGVRTDQNDSAIVRSVLGLGHLLGLDVVAEGVEDAETANWLAEIGCDVLQGFHFARPVPPGSLEAAFTNSGQLGEGRVRYVSEQASPVPVVVPAALPEAVGEEEAAGASHGADVPLRAGGQMALDDLAELACALVGVRGAVITTTGGPGHRARALRGIDPSRLPVENEFWADTVISEDIMEVPDARYDERFSSASLVVNYPYVRFYAGVPMVGRKGRVVGALSVMDTQPHTLTDAQRAHLRALARLTVSQMEVSQADLFERRVTTRVEQLTRLHRATDPVSAAEVIVDVAQKIFRSSGACLLLADAPGAVAFRVTGVSGGHETAQDLTHLVVDSRDDRATNMAVRSREPVFVPDVASADMVSPRLAGVFKMASAIYVPVVTEDAVLGTIVGWWSKPETELPSFTSNLAVLLASEAGTTLSRLRALADLRSAADTDPLTGLANRRGFIRELHMLVPGSSLVMMDLDHFRVVNERYGHHAGDQVLKSFAAHLRSVLRGGDVAARWGGEEFAVALPNCDLEGAARVVQRLRTSWAPASTWAPSVSAPPPAAVPVAASAPLSGCPSSTEAAPTTFSAGLVAMRDRETPEQAIDRADAALAVAKSEGYNRDTVHV